MFNFNKHRIGLFFIAIAMFLSQSFGLTALGAIDTSLDLSNNTAVEPRAFYDEATGLELARYTEKYSANNWALPYSVDISTSSQKLFIGMHDNTSSTTKKILSIIDTSTGNISKEYTAPQLLNAYHINKTWFDSNTNILYIAANEGLFKLNIVTDAISEPYTTYFTSDASSVRYDSVSERIMVAAKSGVYIFNVADDTLHNTYYTSGINTASANDAVLDNTTGYLYYLGNLNNNPVVFVWDTNNPATTTPLKTYTKDSIADLNSFNGYMLSTAEIDENTGELFLSITSNGNRVSHLFVINTATDTLINKYNHTTTPAITGFDVRNVEFDRTNDYLYVTTGTGVSVIDRTNDTVIKNYNVETNPGSELTNITRSAYDSTNNKLYVAIIGALDEPNNLMGEKVVMIDLNEKFETTSNYVTLVNSDEYTSIDTISDGSYEMSYKTGTTTSAWKSNLDDGLTDDFYDIYGWSSASTTVTEANGVITVTPAALDGVYAWFKTGRTDSDKFPAGSKVSVDVKVSGSDRFSYYSLITDGFNEELDPGALNYGKWMHLEFSPTEPFKDIGFYMYYMDEVQIKNFSIITPDENWNDWSAICSEAICPLTGLDTADWLQVRYNLSTADDSTTPRITSATLKAAGAEEPPVDPEPEPEAPRPPKSGSRPTKPRIDPLTLPDQNATTGDLQTKIAALLKMVSDLKAQIATMQSGQTNSGSGYIPLASCPDMELGFRGNCAKELQSFLNKHKFTVSETGPGSEGNETEIFGSATKAALMKFQAANEITPSLGYFGPLTRKIIEAKY